MRRNLRALTPALLWGVAIWLIGGLRELPSVAPGIGLDKAAHFVMYGVLGGLLGRAARTLAWGPGRVALAIAGALLLGAADETRQLRISARSGEVADWLADAAGVVAGFYVAWRVTGGAGLNSRSHEHG